MDPADYTQKIASIKRLADTCTSRLFQLKENEVNEPLPTKEQDPSRFHHFWATRSWAEFNMWCSDLGVESKGQRSIETQLKEMPRIPKIILMQLEVLDSDLDDLKKLRAGTLSKSALAKYLPQKIHLEEEDDDSLVYDSLSSSCSSSGSQANDNSETLEERCDRHMRQSIRDTLDRLQDSAKIVKHSRAQRKK